MEKLPDDIEVVLDRAVETYLAFKKTRREYDNCNPPSRPGNPTIAEWNEYVDSYNEHGNTIAALDIRLKADQQIWRIAEANLIELLPMSVYFQYKGYNIAHRYRLDNFGKRFDYIQIQKETDDCTHT